MGIRIGVDVGGTFTDDDDTFFIDDEATTALRQSI